MSVEEEKSINGRMLVDFFDYKRSLTTLREKKVQLGKRLEQIGKAVQSEREVTRIDIENYGCLLNEITCQEVNQTAADIKTAERESERLKEQLCKLGYGDAVGQVSFGAIRS